MIDTLRPFLWPTMAGLIMGPVVGLTRLTNPQYESWSGADHAWTIVGDFVIWFLLIGLVVLCRHLWKRRTAVRLKHERRSDCLRSL